jgi:hypothetical protein
MVVSDADFDRLRWEQRGLYEVGIEPFFWHIFHTEGE